MGQALITFFFGRRNGREEEGSFARPSPSYNSTGISSSNGRSNGAAPSASAQETALTAGTAVSLAAAGTGGHGGVLSSSPLSRKPAKMEDFEIKSCYLCSIPFDMLVRRHHCRRCWNIFCQKCSSQRDRLLLFGESKPVRLCDDCCIDTPAENHFFEAHVPLLLEGGTLVKGEPNVLLATTPWRRRRRQQPVHLRVTPDLSALEETEDEEACLGSREGAGGGAEGRGSVAVASEGPGVRGGQCITRFHSLDEIESVHAVAEVSGWGGGRSEEDGASATLVIRLRGKGQLKLEAGSPCERDRWVSALGEAVRRLRAPPLADAVEQERWQRRENLAAEAQRLENAQRRRDNEASRAKMAVKYGLDPNKYASRDRGGGGGEGGVTSAGSSRIRQSAAQQQRQPPRAALGGDGGGRKNGNGVGFEGAGADRALRGATRYQPLAGLAR